MPKFTLACDVRLGGKHFTKDSVVELDGSDAKQNQALRDLLSSDRIVESDAALKHLAEVEVKASQDAEAKRVENRAVKPKK